MTFLASLRTARAAAVAGLLFAAVMITALVLTRTAFPYDVYLDTGALPSAEQIERASWALRLVPYGGIAFLWFMAALNYHLGAADNRLFTTVFLCSGTIYIALAFVGTAIGSGELAVMRQGLEFASPTRILAAQQFNELFLSLGFRMAAVFTLALSTFGRVRKVLPLWLSILGTVTGLALLLAPVGLRYGELLFPGWVALVSAYLLIADPGGKGTARR